MQQGRVLHCSSFMSDREWHTRLEAGRGAKKRLAEEAILAVDPPLILFCTVQVPV